MLSATKSKLPYGDTAAMLLNKRPRTHTAKERVKTIYYEEHNMEISYG